MSFFDEYDVDVDEIEEVSFKNAPDGAHEFEIIKIDNWESADGDRKSLRYHYRLDDDPKLTYTEWFSVPNDDRDNVESDEVKRGMSYLKSRLLSLGLNARTAGPEDVESKTGSLILVTTKKKDKEYQNIKAGSLKVDGGAEEKPAPAAKKAPARTRKPAAAKPAPEVPEDDAPEAAETAPVKAAAAKDKGRPAVVEEDDEDYDPFAD